MTSLHVRRTGSAPARGDLALRLMTALLMATAATLVLVGAEAWCGASIEPSLIQLLQ